MNDNVLIVLIIAVAILIILVVFRDRLSRFGLKTKHIKANMETRNPGAINITKSSQKGEENVINVETGDVNISEFDQDGKRQNLNIRKD